MTSKQNLMDQVARLVAELQDAVQLLDESAATQLGLNLTDLRCVRQVIQEGPKSASQLADATGLTRAAISAALDRMEKAKVAKRVPDPVDRRRTLVEPTDSARQQVARIWAPIERQGRRE
ncbi:MAG: MarR family winged helix-turn-helix transcriptional regulator, partial [Acidimicrobiia bacterium]